MNFAYDGTQRAFERADLMVILDGIDDAVVKLDDVTGNMV